MSAEQLPPHAGLGVPLPHGTRESIDDGLDPAEAEARLARFGPNELPPEPREHWIVALGRQLREPMALLLVAAALVAGLGLRERIDAVAILAIVALNAMIGLAQEGKAAHALEALRTMEAPTSRVRRGGRTLVIPAAQIAPGDLVLLSAGDRVPADLELVDAVILEVDESLLTGESLPVPKSTGQGWAPGEADEEGPGQGVVGNGDLTERTDLVFSGTTVTRGRGAGIAIATGPRTQLGAIAERLGEREQQTPLQAELARLTGRLGAISVVIAVAVFGLILLRLGVSHEGAQQAFLASVALAVAAVPEGLATVVTVALALGVRRMADHGAIVRRLPAVETLGSTTVIATDKTGTLTQNRMRLEAVALPGEGIWDADAVPEAPMVGIGRVAVLCNDATRDPPTGDPMDLALLEWAGAERERSLRAEAPRLADLPFDAERRRMTTLHATDGGAILLVKGAPEVVIERCRQVEGPQGPRPLDASLVRDLEQASSDMARRGMRVLALAERELDATVHDPDMVEHDLSLVALLGFRDPIRPEAAKAVAEARSAGIHLVMVTGDHAATAEAIAGEVGLSRPGEPVVTGRDLRQEGFPPDPASVPVYARVDPQQKLALVDGLRAAGHVVAVTGDGVNDAPALKRADIGVAMGLSGSDVARQASDMVVTDDNLATIVRAVREGRGIYDNIRKVVDYLVAGNLSEITVVVSALILFPALGVPLLPLQLLWINLLTDGLPAIALGVDPVDPGLMRRPPRPRTERLLGLRRLGFLYRRALLISAAAVGGLMVSRFAWGEPWPHARALMFTILVMAHLLWAFAARRPTRGALTNVWLLVAVLGGIGLQFLIVAWPAAHQLFGTAHLMAREWALALAGGALPVALILALPAARRRA